MKRLLEVRTMLRPRMELPESAVQALGFEPALLNVATMRIYSCVSTEAFEPLPKKVIAGFERGGFFYTRSAAARACKEWGFGI